MKIARDIYLKKLKDGIGNDMVKVITGYNFVDHGPGSLPKL